MNRYLIIFGALLAGMMAGCRRGPSVTQPQSDTETFNSVAPILWSKCATCHRDGEAAPFALVEYRDVESRTAQVQQVIESGFMPPWLPSDADVQYENDHRLNNEQKDRLLSWLKNDAPEGLPKYLPKPPDWTKGWKLGEPDLVVSMPRKFKLPAAGPDVYRNFVIPIPTDQVKYVRALEFRPSNRKIVHHAFMLIDPTRQLRHFTESDGQLGFAGMDTKSAISPNGHFIGWQPGRLPYEYPTGTAWQLLPGTDLVLQVHMQCSGKPEVFDASVGIYFTNELPTRFPLKLLLRSTDIDIAAGDSNYEINDQMKLPVDVRLMALAPHAHYLAREMYATAELPNGTEMQLLSIKNWDLNWQSEYRFKPWVTLPAGTVLKQRFVYDNSSGNVRNPNQPPRRVIHGPQATDEMGSLWFQVLANGGEKERIQLDRAIARKEMRSIVARRQKDLQGNPNDYAANLEMGKMLIAANRIVAAYRHFERAALTDPQSAEARYFVGHALLRNKQIDFAVEQLENCLELDSEYFAAHYDLGQAALIRQNVKLAEKHFRQALEIYEFDVQSLKQLGILLLRKNQTDEAAELLRKASLVTPHDQSILELIKQAESTKGEIPSR